MMRKRRVAGMIAIVAIVLFIVADMLFSLDLPRQNFFTHLIAFVCILFIGWCFLSKPGKSNLCRIHPAGQAWQVFWRHIL